MLYKYTFIALYKWLLKLHVIERGGVYLCHLNQSSMCDVEISFVYPTCHCCT